VEATGTLNVRRDRAVAEPGWSLPGSETRAHGAGFDFSPAIFVPAPLIFLIAQKALAFAFSLTGSVTIDVEVRSRSTASGRQFAARQAIWFSKLQFAFAEVRRFFLYFHLLPNDMRGKKVRTHPPLGRP
jgi:hypothetical protein